MGEVSTLIEMARLAALRPAPNAPAQVVAAWYEAKAVLHEHLAAECGDELGRARELSYAAQAWRHARSLSDEGVAA